MVSLKPMTMEDADKMLEWKNYIETRQFAILAHYEIKRADHIRWLKQNIHYFQTIYYNGERSGAIRLQEKEVSIWVDRQFRGRGIAVKAIKRVSHKGFTAKIVAGNLASMRCFIKCGYEPISYQHGYYIFKKQ